MSYLVCDGLSPIFAVVATAQGLLFAQADGTLTRVGPDGACEVRTLDERRLLVPDGDGLFVVKESGEAGRIDGSFGWTSLGTVADPVVFIAGDGARHVLGVQSERESYDWHRREVDLLVLETGVRWPMPFPANQAYLDGQGRLWMALDAGEWGGGTWRVDLETGASTKVAGPLRGFLELADGAVYGYGGLAHLYFLRADLQRLDASGVGVHGASMWPLAPPAVWPIRWADDLDGAIITSQRDRLHRLSLDPFTRERLRWRGERVFSSALVDDHLVLVGTTGVIADLDDRVHDYRCLDGSKPKRLSRREARGW